MKSLAFRRFVAIAVICVLMVSGLTAAADPALVTKDAMVYESYDTSSKALGKLSEGVQLELVAEKGGWAMVTLNGSTGFMEAGALAAIQTYKDKTAYASEDAPMYKSCSSASKKMGVIPSGSKVSVLATAGDWARVKYGKYTGFMRISKLGAAAPEKAQSPQTSVTAYASVDGAKVYNAKGKVISKVALNTEVVIRETRGDVCRVERGGATAYMMIDELSPSKVQASEEKKDDGITEISPTTYYVKSDKAKVYNGKGKTIGTLTRNAAVTVNAYNDTLARVVNGSTVGFMYRADLSAQKAEEKDDGITEIAPTTFYVKKNKAKVYNAKGKVIGRLALNTDVTVTAYTDTLAKVSRGGQTGLMYRTDLSDHKTEETNGGVTEISPTTYYVKSDKAKVYNAKGKEIGTLSQNAAVTVNAYNDTLARVVNGSAVGFMRRADLSAQKTEEKKDDVTEITPTTFYVKNDGAKVLDASGKEIGTLGQNAAVTVNAYNDTLARVVNGSAVGFMRRADLSAQKTEEKKDDVTEITPTTFYVKNDGAKVLDASGKEIGTLSQNAAVTVNAYNDTLARVVNGSVVGFMRRADLSAEKVKTTLVLQYGDKGEAVSKVQSRLKELGYFAGTVGGNYLDLTQSAVSAFQTAAGIKATGIADEATLNAMFAENAPKKPAPAPSEAGNSTVKAATGTAKEMDWWTSGIQSIYARGTVATITDVQTGIAWREKRSGGTNHADVQPLTASDTAAMKKAVGSWSWTRRAIFVTIDGVNYAASMNCMPHGSGSIKDNNFNGHHCIHFTNSRTHGSNKVCSLHQAAIKKAAKATL